MQIIQEHFGKGHAKEGIYLSNMGDVFRKQKQFEKAYLLQKHALGILQAVYGQRHPEGADVLFALGKTRADSGKYGAAQKLFRKALVCLCDVIDTKKMIIG